MRVHLHHVSFRVLPQLLMSLRTLALSLLIVMPACASSGGATREHLSGSSNRISAPASLAGQAPIAAGTTTVIVVRHAEKATDDPRDPSLDAAGQLRAQTLAAALEDAGVTALYATQYKRTRATAEPLAGRLKLPVMERPVASGNADEYAPGLAQEILLKHRGGAVVVVGHSNTVPAIVQALSGRKVAPITEAEYDHMFIVIVPNGGGSPRLLKARYGEAGAVVPSR